ncbi:MAG TPA: YggS family pyridoxal phosphate-dependent enzyme [Aggregatilineales bacterium]|nr:YggS family pyridoxal phosphate-dependent enzyme [Aggregatilineales bacterium]
MSITSGTTIADRLALVRETIGAACRRVGRPSDSVTLIAVGKTHPPATLLEAVACGQIHFGENRVEEAAEKIPAVEDQLARPVTWHMIGHVQNRKAEDVVALFDVIHSLDSVKLAERYSRFAVELEKMVTVLLEVNVSGEASKSGFNGAHWERDSALRAALWSDVARISALPGIRLEGLMTVAPIATDPETVRPVFASLRRLRDALASDLPRASWRHLSMGMTDDYPVAIEEGSTMVRIGRAIFGERL